MSLTGSCACNNIQVHWQCVDLSLVPRACQCDYCRDKQATYVAKSGTSVAVNIRDADLHNVVQHGSGTALFHECRGCGELVFVSAEIEGEHFAALNAGCINNTVGFSAAVPVNYAGQCVGEKQQRWRENWCCPLSIVYNS